jgi:hypothetical protein
MQIMSVSQFIDMESIPDDFDASKQFASAIKEHNAFYYARPRETFSQAEAEQLALTAGRDILVLEDLS